MTATDIATAAFVLKEAEAAGYAFASNGIELVTKEPTGIPPGEPTHLRQGDL
jgi:hypothetical protein